jgi:hypothetical protein
MSASSAWLDYLLVGLIIGIPLGSALAATWATWSLLRNGRAARWTERFLTRRHFAEGAGRATPPSPSPDALRFIPFRTTFVALALLGVTLIAADASTEDSFDARGTTGRMVAVLAIPVVAAAAWRVLVLHFRANADRTQKYAWLLIAWNASYMVFSAVDVRLERWAYGISPYDWRFDPRLVAAPIAGLLVICVVSRAWFTPRRPSLAKEALVPVGLGAVGIATGLLRYWELALLLAASLAPLVRRVRASRTAPYSSSAVMFSIAAGVLLVVQGGWWLAGVLQLEQTLLQSARTVGVVQWTLLGAFTVAVAVSAGAAQRFSDEDQVVFAQRRLYSVVRTFTPSRLDPVCLGGSLGRPASLSAAPLSSGRVAQAAPDRVPAFVQ